MVNCECYTVAHSVCVHTEYIVAVDSKICEIDHIGPLYQYPFWERLLCWHTEMQPVMCFRPYFFNRRLVGEWKWEVMREHLFITALHGMQCGLTMRFLSVCLSVKRVHCDKTEESYV